MPADGRQPVRRAPVGTLKDRLSSAELVLWPLLLSISSPLRRFVAFQLFVGRSLWSLLADLQRGLWAAVGWFSAPVRSGRVQRLGRGWFTIHRFHIVVGKGGCIQLLDSQFEGAAGQQKLVHVHIPAVAGALAALVRYGREKLRVMNDPIYRRRLDLQRQLKEAKRFEAWQAAARELNTLNGLSQASLNARWSRETRLYDRKLLAQRLEHLRAVRRQGNIQRMLFAMRQDLLRNLGNMTNSELHEYFTEVPQPIREYIEEVKSMLWLLTDFEDPSMRVKERWEFIKLTRHAFGRTALVLSGGGALGAFHLGVVKALYEQGQLPRVLAGSSVGAIVAAIIAVRDEFQLHDLIEKMHEFDLSFFSNSTSKEFLKHFLLKGTLQDMEVLQKRLRRLLGDVTFLEAFNRSGRVLNVAVSAADTNEPPRVLNYLTSPNVVIWSAVSCSSAFPYLFKPQELLSKDEKGNMCGCTPEAMPESARRWADGSLEEDLPMRTLSEMFNVNYFLVSQTNPHIVPALNLKKHFNRKLGNLLEQEWKHRCQQLQLIVPRPIARWLKVLSQPWEGDVTMVLPSAYSQIKKAITNPTSADLQEACLQGEQSTWAKMSAIECNCGIEVTLDRCLRKLEARARHARSNEIQLRRMAGMPRSAAAEEAAAASGQPSQEAQEAAVRAQSVPAGGLASPRRSSSGALLTQFPARASPQQLPTMSTSESASRILRTTGSSGSAERLDREREQKDRVAAARRGMGSRIPSWLHLTALGLPSVPSEENLANLRDGRYMSTDDLPAMPRPQSSNKLHTLGSGIGASSLEAVLELEPSGVSKQQDDSDPVTRLEPSYGDGWSSMEYPDWAPEAYDCTDSSADIWKTLLPLAAAADNSPADPATSSQGLDLIAP